jgi:OOP family OmpA-OmpF porin
MRKFFLVVLIFNAVRISAQELKPTATQALLNVEVVDDKNKPQAAQAITFASTKDGKEFTGTTNADGKFSILIPPGQKYKVKYKIFNTTYEKLSLEMPEATDGAYTIEYTITVTPPRTFTLNNVFFDLAKSTLRPESNKELDQLAEYMNRKKTLVIEIAGHTDNTGKDDANQKLSEDRANAVRQYLLKKGIAAERVTAKGYGASQPAADNDTEAGKQKNRRTEVRIISE